MQPLEEFLTKGLAYFAERWPASTQTTSIGDPITQFVCDSVVDALLADHGILDLQPAFKMAGTVLETLSQSYSEGTTKAEIRYFIRNRGSRPLLLINSTGVPIDIWHSFLADPEHDFRIIVPERRGTDLLNGGLQEPVDIATESTDLGSILDAESIERIEVVAWCNGTRLAIELATLQPARIGSIVLLTPTFKGLSGKVALPSQFERDLQLLFDSVLQQPDLAEFFCQTIAEQGRELPDWDRLKDQPAKRAQKLFEMPSQKHAGVIVAPMTEPESFLNMTYRVASDENHATKETLQRLTGRMLVLMGSHDHIVSNGLTLCALEQIKPNSVVAVTVSGAGHYIHDLQYRYFRFLLDRFLPDRGQILSTARMSVYRCVVPA